METKVRFQDSRLELREMREKIISSDLDVTKYMDISYIECTFKKLSAAFFFLLLTTILTRIPVVWSTHSHVWYTFIPSHLWHSESKYLAKLHHKSLSLPESCENLRHLTDVVHLLLGLSEKVSSALISKVWGNVLAFSFLMS